MNATASRPEIIRTAWDGGHRVNLLRVKTVLGDLFHVTYDGHLIGWTPFQIQAEQTMALLCAQGRA